MKFGIYALRNAPHFHVFTVREFRACRISYNRYMVLYNRHRKVSHTKIHAIILHKTKRNEDREKQQNPASHPNYNHCSRYRIVWHSHKTHKILWHNAEIFGQPSLRGLGNKNLKNDNLFPRKTRAACFETNWRCFEACGFYFRQFRQRLCLYPLSVSKHARYFSYI